MKETEKKNQEKAKNLSVKKTKITSSSKASMTAKTSKAAKKVETPKTGKIIKKKNFAKTASLRETNGSVKRRSVGSGETKLNHFSEYDIYLFREGRHFHLYDKLGSHLKEVGGASGVYFAVFAPHASYVSVICDHNHWDAGAHPLTRREDGSGIWETWIPGIGEGEKYKYHITNQDSWESFEKIDPFARYFEVPPLTASIVKSIDTYKWRDDEWRKKINPTARLDRPIAIYEVHLGSWKRKEGGEYLSYRELADDLIPYIKDLGYTHIELMPITEHPFDLSWGYQSLGYFAPTSRFGDPEDFMAFIDQCHQNDIGVILDFVPAHFPCDAHGLFRYDGGNIFEYSDWQKQIHPDWQSAVFNFDSRFVRNFLIASALFFLEKYHIDGFRIDAVASMLYLDYSRREGEWSPNYFGGRENLEAISFLKEFNETIFRYYPYAHVIAEESTAWTGVSKPIELGGLGFDLKWMMGWMHDVLRYFQKETVYRKHHHHDLTFGFLYFDTENFLLPLSHDEVTHGKGSLISRMPGDYWQKFANLRLLYSFQYLHPGAKLLFMGSEFGQFAEWNSRQSLDWHLLDYDAHQTLPNLIRDLNHLYRSEPALYQDQFTTENIIWVEQNDYLQSVLSFIRRNRAGDEILVVGNFTENVHHDFRIGIPQLGEYREIFNSDANSYGGSGVEVGEVTAENISFHGQPFSIEITVAPLAIMVFKRIANNIK